VWLERLAVNATVLGSMAASFDTEESERAAEEAMLNNVHKKEKTFKTIRHRVFATYNS
jgi:hypothetical protein